MSVAARPASRWAALLTGVALSALLLYLAFRKVNFEDVRRAIAAIDARFLVIALVTKLIGLLFVAWRGTILLRRVSSYSFSTVFRAVMLALAVNNVFPFRVGDLASVEYLARRGSASRTACLAFVAFARLLDALSLMLIILATLPLIAIRLPLRTSFFVLVILLATVFVVLAVIARNRGLTTAIFTGASAPFGPRVRAFVARRVDTFMAGVDAARSAPALAAVFGCSVAYWLMSVMSIQTWIWAFGWHLPWYAPIVVLAFVSFGIAIPTTPGQIGTYHFFASAAMLTLGVSRSDAISFAIVGHAMAIIPFTLAAVPMLLHEYVGYIRRPVTGSEGVPPSAAL